MALAGALAVAVSTAVAGVTNRSLRAQVSALLGVTYTMGQASYDLRYVLPPDAQRFAVFYTKVHDRLLRPLLAADRPPAPIEVRQALRTLDHAVTDYINNTRITT